MNGLLSGLNHVELRPCQRLRNTAREVAAPVTLPFFVLDDHRLKASDAVTVRRPRCPLPSNFRSPRSSDACSCLTPEADCPARMFWTLVCAVIAVDRYAAFPLDSAGER